MYRESVGENRRTRAFREVGKRISAQTRATARLKGNPDAIFAFIPSFSVLP